MKKLLVIVVLGLLWGSTGFAERVTLGFAGDSCPKFNKNKKKFGKEFDELFKSEMIGFLTGFNMHVAENEGSANNMKTLDHHSTDYAYSYIVEYCRKKPDDHVFRGLIKYYNLLPK